MFNDVQISLKSPENQQNHHLISYRSVDSYQPHILADLNPPALLKKLAPAATALVATTDSSRGRVPKAQVLRP